MDELDKLRNEYKDDKEFNQKLYEYLTYKLPKDKYKDFVEKFVPLMDQYNIDEKIKDAIVAMILYEQMKGFIEHELPKCVYNALHGKIPLDVIKEKLSNSISLLNNEEARKEFGKSYYYIKGLNDGNQTLINIFKHISTSELIKTLIHEALHQVTHYEAKKSENKNKLLKEKTKINKKGKIYQLSFSGVKVSYEIDNPEYQYSLDISKTSKTIEEEKYTKLNEAITEYLTKKVMGDLYPKTEKETAYINEVLILEELIEDNILDEETIINAYISNDITIILNNLYDVSILNRFTNGYKPKKVSHGL